MQSYFDVMLVNTSLSMNLTCVLLKEAFEVATSRASLEMSAPVMFELGRSFFNVIGMQPLPVPISKISISVFRYFFM